MDSDPTAVKVSDGTSPLSGMLSTLLSNPEMLGQLQSLLGGINGKQTGGESAEAQASAATAQGEATGGGEIAAPAADTAPTDGLASVLANPELMAKLPQMMAMLKPMLEKDFTKSPPEAESAKSSEDCRNDLLLALKPFLSAERRNAVDAMLRISKLGNVLRQIK